jgi:hypothetical protein
MKTKSLLLFALGAVFTLEAAAALEYRVRTPGVRAATVHTPAPEQPDPGPEVPSDPEQPPETGPETPPPPPPPAPTIATIVSSNGARQWSDGTSSSSCLGYLTGDAQHEYSGATGDGTYRIRVNGTDTNVYCDMAQDGGGWTLVARGSPNGTSQPEYKTSAAYNLAMAASYTGSTFKFSDSSINSLKTSAYRTTSTGPFVMKRFFQPGCTYDAVNPATDPNSLCLKSYAALDWSGLKQGIVGTGKWAGLSDRSSDGSLFIITSDLRTYSWFASTTGTGTQYGAGYGNGAAPTIYVWVR